ncbi:MAG: TetR/AcrR family transcriptional regulator [Pseudomonadota bacterium]
MSRSKTYKPNEALNAAMCLFWRRGFAETSYGDLTRETGVSRKGLYSSFGDKRSLFIKSLRHYRQNNAIEFLSELDEPEADLKAIKAMFLRIASLAKSTSGRTGCFMANTANDEMSSDPDVEKEIRAHLNHLSKRFKTVLERSGYEKSRAISLANYFTGLLQGLFVFAHAGADKRLIDSYVTEGLKVVEG